MTSNPSDRDVLHDGDDADPEPPMPRLGLGTWQNVDPDQCAQTVRTAIDIGYRHVDTAQVYGNEKAVGEGIASSSVPREALFLATKVWIEKCGHDDVLLSTLRSLERLGTDYVDLLYVHYPAKTYEPEETLRAFQTLHEKGRIRKIGVSNFDRADLETARSVLEVPLYANQVELHPLHQQEELRRYCNDHDIEVVAYSPLCRGNVFDVREISRIAAKHDVSEPQVSLTWLLEKGVTPIPKATSQAHLRDNWQSLTLQLDDEDIDSIDSIDRQEQFVESDWNGSTD